jgi:tetratricopeptide (TPR) repeat protein
MPYGLELNRLAVLWAEQPRSTCFAALAEALRKRGALDEAAAVATAGVAARPEFLPGHIVLARIHCDRQQWDAASAEIQAALMLDPGHPVALEAREAAALATGHPPTARHSEPSLLEFSDDGPGEMVYTDDVTDEAPATPVAEAVLTESLAMLYHGQGHTAQAVAVLDALVARSPENRALVAKRDAVRAELDGSHPSRYAAARSGGVPLGRWLSSLATVRAPGAPPASSFDAFFQTPAARVPDDGDLAAFQAWLRELDQ